MCHPSEGRLLSHLEIQTRYSIKCTFLEALSMRLNIPVHWRSLISDNWISLPQHGTNVHVKLNNEEPLVITALSAKKMYRSLVTQGTKNNAVFNRWTLGVDNVTVDNAQEWEQICTRIFKTSCETKLQSLQYKLINRIIPCGVHLRQLRIRETEECPHCQLRDTIMHFFYQCQKVQVFWNKVSEWFRQAANLYLHRLTPKEFLFGIPSTSHKSKVINFILIQVRFYIFRQKLFYQSELSVLHWLREFKGKLEMEKWINTRLGKPRRFECWKEILKEIG